MSILAIVFLQIANTLSRGKLTRSDAFLGFVRNRNQRIGDGLDALMHAAGAFLVYVLVTAFQPLFLRSWGPQRDGRDRGAVHGADLAGASDRARRLGDAARRLSDAHPVSRHPRLERGDG